jgi:predicted phage-related endonuclease
MLTDEQKRNRKQYLGGSDVAAVLGVEGAFGGPWRVWRSKVAEVVDDIDPDLALVGNELEPVVIELAARRLGMPVTDGPTSVRHPNAPLGGHPDGWLEGAEELEGLEVKTIQRGGPIRLAAYEAQARTYMACSGAPRWHLVALHVRPFPPALALRWAGLTVAERADAIEALGWQVEVHTFDRDARLERFMVSTLTEWWNRHVLGGEEPEVDGSRDCADALLEAHPAAEDLEIDAEDIADAVREYRDLGVAIKEMEARRDVAANVIKARLGDAKKGRTSAGVVSWSRFEVARLDTAALKAVHPELVRQYTTPSASGRLTVSKK